MATSMGTAKATDFILVPPGTYRVRIAGVEGVDPPEDHPDYGPGLQWTFDLIDPEDAELAAEFRDAGQKFGARTGLVAGPNSKARKWVESLRGSPLDEGEEATTEMVVGRIADALVTNKPNQKGVTRHYIETLVPVKKKKPIAELAEQAKAAQDGADEELPF
jgi:hypothetical protein